MEPVINLKEESLDRIGKRIDAAWQRMGKGTIEWVEGSLELMQALREARDKFGGNDRAFGAWLKENGHDHLPKDDRAALIKLGENMDKARGLLSKTENRSYQYIYRSSTKDQSKGGSGKSKGGGKSSKGKSKDGGKKPRQEPKRDDRTDDVMSLNGQGLSDGEIATKTGIPKRQVRHIIDEEMIRLGAWAKIEELIGAASAKNFSEKGVLSVNNAIRILKERIAKTFTQRVNDEVIRRIAAADDATRQQNKELREENRRLETMLNKRGVFTEAQFKKLQMCVHPDNPASEPVRREMQALLNDKTIQRKLIIV